MALVKMTNIPLIDLLNNQAWFHMAAWVYKLPMHLGQVRVWDSDTHSELSKYKLNVTLYTSLSNIIQSIKIF